MVAQIVTQPAPDGESIAEVVRERYQELIQRGRPSSLPELDEIVRLHKLLCGHIVYIQEDRRATTP